MEFWFVTLSIIFFRVKIVLIFVRSEANAIQYSTNTEFLICLSVTKRSEARVFTTPPTVFCICDTYIQVRFVCQGDRLSISKKNFWILARNLLFVKNSNRCFEIRSSSSSAIQKLCELFAHSLRLAETLEIWRKAIIGDWWWNARWSWGAPFLACFKVVFLTVCSFNWMRRT